MYKIETNDMSGDEGRDLYVPQIKINENNVSLTVITKIAIETARFARRINKITPRKASFSSAKV